ncbi:CAIB/BAIF family protein [Sphingobium herbicidovorans NBRC 16415]|uniref:CAIB/BAIF family protein n=1 Tax=Sphingobium herbicidovorans (strain ATCC 700291 / DSM 11019 / CCUG 56400 / KCTC 2939 / LMG 18315 / NBRC 16415 / MH) TaxID=1219045 RepID=A0A086PBX6_SPHHM|nr:CoA transferase [Sphingobium herbicidovorans]KFG90894.1 CAIB/BAIF family protein [Sphingobium herbicidovorans NBRC 16415]
MYDVLSGLSLIEASSFVASPSAGLYCAQMGMEVIRVDQIGGGPDFHRWPVTANDDSLYWENLNRAKKSVAIDLARPEGRELLQALVKKSGQFITNFPADGFLSHEALSADRADLVTVRVMGWPDGRPALDYTVNNAVGYPMMTGQGPEPVNHVLPAWDLLSGAHAAFSLLALILHRTATGKGGEARIPLSDVAIGTVANLGGLAEVLATGQNRPRLGNVVYGLFGRDFVTADGVRTMIVVVTPRQWKNLVEALALNEAIAAIEAKRGVSFAKDDGTRFSHRDALFPLFEQAIGARNHADLTAALDAGGVVHSSYRTMLEAAQDPALVDANPIFGNAENPSGLIYPAAGAFATIPQLDRGAPRPAPRNGQHSEEILSKYLGLTGAAFGRLVDNGTVGRSDA